jgi:hypothetical protein
MSTVETVRFKRKMTVYTMKIVKEVYIILDGNSDLEAEYYDADRFNTTYRTMPHICDLQTVLYDAA